MSEPLPHLYRRAGRWNVDRRDASFSLWLDAYYWREKRNA